MRNSTLMVLCGLVVAAFAAGCRTPAQQSKRAHAKFDPWVAKRVAATEAELEKEMPRYRWVIDVHDQTAAYLVKYATAYKDKTFNASISDLYRRNADVYVLLEDDSNAEKYRSLAAQYTGGGTTPPPAAGGGTAGEVAAGTAGPAAEPDAGGADAPPPIPEARARVAVLAMGEPEATKKTNGYGDQFSGKLNAALRRLGHFELVNRGAVSKLIREKNLAETEYVEGDDAKRLGKLLQVDYLVVGHVGPDSSGEVFNISARLVATSSGQEIASVEGLTKEGIAGFGAVAKKFALELAQQYQSATRGG